LDHMGTCHLPGSVGRRRAYQRPLPGDLCHSEHGLAHLKKKNLLFSFARKARVQNPMVCDHLCDD
jgi:hypothetical protein